MHHSRSPPRLSLQAPYCCLSPHHRQHCAARAQLPPNVHAPASIDCERRSQPLLTSTRASHGVFMRAHSLVARRSAHVLIAKSAQEAWKHRKRTRSTLYETLPRVTKHRRLYDAGAPHYCYWREVQGILCSKKETFFCTMFVLCTKAATQKHCILRG